MILQYITVLYYSTMHQQTNPRLDYGHIDYYEITQQGAPRIPEDIRRYVTMEVILIIVTMYGHTMEIKVSK